MEGKWFSDSSIKAPRDTGEISLEMLKDLGVQFCLAGHSERRHVIKEPSELVARKAGNAPTG